MKNSSYLPAYEDGTVCSETSAYKTQTPGNYPEESIKQGWKTWKQVSERGDEKQTAYSMQMIPQKTRKIRLSLQKEPKTDVKVRVSK
jgi:hypothetical protein